MNTPPHDEITRDSPLHRLDPRVKLVTALIFIAAISLMPGRTVPAFGLIWLLIAVIAKMGRISVLRLAKLGGVALPFALAAVTLLFTTPGQPIFSALGLTMTDAGLSRFVAILLKSWLAVQVSLLLTLTTPFPDIVKALRSLRVPSVLVSVISLTYRYWFTLKDEAEKMLRARAARSATQPGLRSGGSLLWRAQTAGNMVGTLFLRSYERSERIYAAMLARGYRGEMRDFAPPPLPRRDVFCGALVVLILLAIEFVAYWA